jgi:hypothetical protein
MCSFGVAKTAKGRFSLLDERYDSRNKVPSCRFLTDLRRPRAAQATGVKKPGPLAGARPR